MTESEAVEAIQFDLKIGGEIHSQVLRDAVGVAIQALEKQISKKVLNKKDGLFANCPNCGCVQNGVWNKTYCGDCGKKLDWSDEE